jgi:hypothetical protein
MFFGAFRRAAGAAMVGAVVLAAACVERPSSKSAPEEADASVQGAAGTVGAQLSLPGGEQLSAVTYTLTNGTNTYTGTVDVSGQSSATFVVAGVASGTGYVLKIAGLSNDGTVSCSGSSPALTVSDRATTMALVQLVCIVTAEAGGVVVGGNSDNCAVWNTIVANPSSAPTSGSVTLNAAATAPSPGAITFTWMVTSGTGTISNNTSAVTANGAGATDTATFTCPPILETDTIQLVVGDGPLPDGGSCPDSFTTGTVQVVCELPPCFDPTRGGGRVATPNSATGACPPEQSNAGTPDSQGNYCCVQPTRPCVPGSGVVATPNTLTGSCPSGQINIGPDPGGNYCCGSSCTQPKLPCTEQGQTCCVPCSGSPNGICTQTEALFVVRDIQNGRATLAGESAGACYTCLLAGGCLDDPSLGDTNEECGDLMGTFPVGPAAGTAQQPLCLNTLSCILASRCASPTSGVSSCYCGNLPLPGACSTTSPDDIASNPFDGAPCTVQEADGLGSFGIDNHVILGRLDDTTLPSGRANGIFACAAANGCAGCFGGIDQGCGLAPSMLRSVTVPGVGGTARLEASVSQQQTRWAIVPPFNLSFVWSSFAGTLSDETVLPDGITADATFTCPASGGTVPVTVVVNAGMNAKCGTLEGTATTVVNCPSPSDAGADAATPACDAAALVPCTAQGQTCCAPCAGSANGVCTPTEALFVAHDIANGVASTAGEPSNGCYPCLVASGCVDDIEFPGDTGHECGDLPDVPLGAGAQAGTTEPTLCLNTLSCLLSQPSCASVAVEECFCGTAEFITACEGDPAPGPINGACAQQIANGLGFPPSDGTDVAKHLTDTTLPAGMADQIFQCALTNACSACLH